MIATSIGQSQRLLELWLDPKTADMYYPYLGAGQYGDIPRVGFPIEHSGGRDIPAWSLSALLRVLPLGTELYKMRNDAHEIYYEIDCADATGWVGYEDSDPITAAYEMVCWLLEQGLIKKGGQDGN